MNKNFLKSASAWLLIIMAFFVAMTLLDGGTTKKSEIVYTELINEIERGNVKSIYIDIDTGSASGEFRDGTSFTTTVNINTTEFEKMINEYNKTHAQKVQLKYVPPSKFPFWVSALPNIIMVIMLLVIWFIFLQQAQGGGGGKGVMNFGKSRAKLVTNDKKRITFDDVAGADEEKAELQEVVDFFKKSKKIY